MPYKIICGLFVGALMVASQATYAFGPFENRFSISLEYQLMDLCVDKPARKRMRRIRICACALEKTQENGWLPDYDNDKDFWDNRKKFLKKFRKNEEAC